MRIVLLVLALALAAPAAAQTGLPATVSLEVVPFDEPLEVGVPRTTVALVDYCYVGAGALSLDPTTVRVTAREATEDVVVSVSPATLLFDPSVDPLDPAPCASPQSVNVTALLVREPEADVVLRVVAEAEANPPLEGARAEARLVVARAAVHEPDVAEAMTEELVEAEAEPRGLGAGAVTVLQAALLGAAAAVGALGGTLKRRR